MNSKEPGGRIRKRDAATFACFVALWLVPAVYAGLVGRPIPGTPRVHAYLTSVSCLFTLANPYTAFDYIQVQPTPGAGWVTVPDHPYFRMSPFGYRTRLDEYMRHAQMDGPGADEFAIWFYWRYRQLHPDRPPLAGVRLVAGMIPRTLDVPAGHFRKPPLEELPPDVPRVWLTRTFGPLPR
jgi:hypothetical protein